MNVEEIREIAINSAETYYNFLDQNEKGVQQVDVFELEYLHGSEMVLKIRLSAKLYDTETLFFKNLKNDIRYDTTAIKIIEYDSEKNILLIKPNEKSKNAFELLRNTDLKVISDLKFLVERVKRWYEVNGSKIALPSKASKFSKTYQNITFFDEEKLHPSDNQKQAIATLFTNPFTYVWGAPGTGKTQFVLSYAILHYIKNGDRVAILAPTNNAIEQVLRGVIKMTDMAGVDRRQILRLGAPSKTFAEQFPEVCEEMGINKNLQEIDNQIDILKRVQNFNDTMDFVDHGKQLIPLLDEPVELSKMMKNDKNSRKQIQENAKPIITSIKQSFDEFPEWAIFVEDLSIFNCKMIQKQLTTAFHKLEKQLETDESLFKEYMHSDFDLLDSQLEALYKIRENIAITSTEQRLRVVNVIACTIDGYISRYTDAKLKADHIFLDEAGYANMVKALTLFNNGIPITFFGDHKQLPPVCEINDFEMENEEDYHNMFLWAQSSIFLDTLFVKDRNYCRDQYFRNGNFSPVHMVQTSLNATYRFGENLAKVLARFVYTPSFHSLNQIGETRIHFVHAKKVDQLKSRCSINEATEIKKVVIGLKQNGNNDFIILTPYKNQVKLLNKNLPQERNDYKILTVHGSQGREWDTVILSVVDTSDKWFVDTTRPITKGIHLLNTAVSRARKTLIIVCDVDYWETQHGQLITELYKVRST